MRILRVLTVVALGFGSLAVAAPAASGAPSLAPRGSDCDFFESLRAEVQDLESASAFDAGGYKDLGKAFKKASKDAPKEIKKAMKKVGKFYATVGKSKNENAAIETYSTGLEKYADEITELGTYLAENCGGASGGSASGGGGGTLTLAGETIDLGSGRCYLQEQEAAGQKILLTGQASGTNANGDDVMVDFTRYDESSQFAGDDVSITVGDFRSGDAVSWSGRYDSGTVERSGDTLSVSDVEVRNEQFETAPMSFEINC